eukprot:3940729-Rhodomonas_salina.1
MHWSNGVGSTDTIQSCSHTNKTKPVTKESNGSPAVIDKVSAVIDKGSDTTTEHTPSPTRTTPASLCRVSSPRVGATEA